MPRFELVGEKEEALISAQISPNKPPRFATTPKRSGGRGNSKYRNLLVPSFSLEDIPDNGENSGNNGRNNELVKHSDSLATFSFSSAVYGGDNDGEVWVTKIQYIPRDGLKLVGRNSATTTIITTARDGNMGVKKVDPFANDPDLVAAHMYIDEKLKEGQIVASGNVTTALSMEEVSKALSAEQSSSQPYFSIEIGALLKRLFDAFWECDLLDGCVGDDDDETLTTYTNTHGDGGTVTIPTIASRYDDDTLTFDDTLTYRGLDGSTLSHEGTMGTYNEIATLGDEISIQEEQEGRDDIEGNEESVTNQDSSYGSGSFRSPLSVSYRSTSHSQLPLGESRSRSLRSNSQFRISMLVPETNAQGLKVGAVDGMDSLEYSNSTRRLNPDLINSFIEVKSNSVSSHQHRDKQLRQQETTKKNDPSHLVFTIDDVEELEQYETEQREGSESDHNRRQPVWRTFDTPPKPMKAKREAKKTEDVSSKTVKITITKTQKIVNAENDETSQEENCTSHSREVSTEYCTPPNSHHSRSIHSRSNSSFGTKTCVDDEVRDDPEPNTASKSCEPSYRISKPVLPVEVDPATIAVAPSQSKKLSVLKIKTKMGAEEDPSSPIKRAENFSPLARLRNPISYDIIMSLD